MRRRQNPLGADALTVALAPMLPWLIGGAVLYFYGADIMTAISARFAGKSVEEFKKASSTVTTAITHPITTTKDLVLYATGNQSTVAQSATGKNYVVPFPNPQSQAEFRANIAAIDAAMKKATRV